LVIRYELKVLVVQFWYFSNVVLDVYFRFFVETLQSFVFGVENVQFLLNIDAGDVFFPRWLIRLCLNHLL
jgi:hypothetical protein